MQGRTRGAAALIGMAWLCAAAPLDLAAQERGAIALGELVAGLGVNTRVLMIGAHPDDEDTNLITWLQRGRYVETAYLSLTRGDGGQNLIGNELGEALGVIRTEELLAARRIDGARQYFTRAFDFGFSKDTIDTYRHWQRDSILGDVVRVVREMRPHVIVAVFSGTTRDGHGHHQVSGLLARAAYDASGDTVRFPIRAYGSPWTVPKFYRSARGSAQNSTLGVDVGEYSPLLGRSFGEIAGESRSQHRSQGFGALQRKGPIMNYVRREASRVNEATAANTERSMVDGIDTTWARFRKVLPEARLGVLLESIGNVAAAARSGFDAFAPEKVVDPLIRMSALLQAAMAVAIRDGDLASSLAVAHDRTQAALRVASGVVLEAESLEDWAVDAPMPVLMSLYNNGRDTITVARPGEGAATPRLVPPGGVIRDTAVTSANVTTQPWWLVGERNGGMFNLPASARPEGSELRSPSVVHVIGLRGQSLSIMAPVQFRFADQVKGEVVRRAVGVPLITVTPDASSQLARANAALDRTIIVRVRSAPEMSVSEARVTLVVPAGLTVDTATHVAPLRNQGDEKIVAFRVRGRLRPGMHSITVEAELNGRKFTSAVQVIDYDHIRRQRVYRPASILLTAVDVNIPATLRVAYVTGVSDNIAPTLSQLGIPVTVVAATDLVGIDLSRFSAVVIGPRAYDARPQLASTNARLFDFARAGGALVVQYGQFEMTEAGMTPFPITINRPHDRVTHEDAPVTILDPSARELTWPNRITDADFAGWVQERGLYMPRTFDANYRALFAMNDPNEAPIRGGVLVAPLGKGKYIYTSLAFFRQLPAGVPGAARLFVNLLSANLTPTAGTP